VSVSFINLNAGDPAPWFHVPSTTSPRYAFDTAAGRFIVLCFFGTAGDKAGQRALSAITNNRKLFDDARISLFGVTVDRSDQERVKESSANIGYTTLEGARDVAKISAIGIGMRSHAGVAAMAFKALADKGINIRAITTSEIKFAVLFDAAYTELAVRTLHTLYGLDKV
jgi:peroxiredoxin